jgi:gamma-glutamylcyclotransferase (GGCT)/AIG2-like uncharacterized protein YtfP
MELSEESRKNLSMFQEYMQEKIEEARYTQDFTRLQTRTHHLLFTYGTLMRGFPNCRPYLQGRGATYVCDGHTWSSQHVMYRLVQANPFPFILNTDNYKLGARVRGEVWLVAPSLIKDLDNLESNGVYYNRRESLIQMSIPGVKHRPMEHAWMYHGIPEFWNKVIADPHSKTFLCQTFSAKKHPECKYYHYTAKTITSLPKEIG